MKYSIVIATYNHCDDLLKKCVEAIVTYTHLPDIELVIIANGCFDETKEYLLYLEAYFKRSTIGGFQQVFFAEPLGYARANNIGIRLCHADKIVLLNNDAFLLAQNKSDWLTQMDQQFQINPKCGISGPLKTPCNLTPMPYREFVIFFCVMIKREVFDRIGLLNEDYGKGGGEDTEFCFKAEDEGGYDVNSCAALSWSEDHMLHVGNYPIYHRGEGTVHDKSLVPDWTEVFDRNSLKVASKYGRDWYRNRLGNNYERAVYLKEDPVAHRELTRYQWAAKNIVGKKVLEIGCSIGYGLQFLPEGIDYTGLDISQMIITAAKGENWRPDAKFIAADINTFPLEQYDTIIAFEVIEHMDNGFAVVEKLKEHCHQLLITVPKDEPPGLWGPHHHLHGLNEQHFPGFDFNYIDFDGGLHIEEPVVVGDRLNLLVGKWSNTRSLKWLESKHPGMYKEVIAEDIYRIKHGGTNGRNVLDIGANIGAFALFASQQGAKKVVAVEPVGTTFETLNENVERSGFAGISLVHGAAVTVPRDITINLHSDSGHNSMYELGVATEVVHGVEFGSLLNMFDGDDIYLKVDCEGAEYDIILGATKEQLDRVSDIVMEIHTDLHPVHKGAEVIEEKLRSCGFYEIEKQQVYFWPANDPTNMTPLPVVVVRWSKTKPPAKVGLDWFGVKHPGIFKEIIGDDTYKIAETNLKDRNVIDIGANVGTFTLLADYLGAKRVVAVEPTQATYQTLLENIETAGAKSVVPLQYLVSDVAGKFCDISVNPANNEENSMYRTHGEFESVETTTLHDLLTHIDGDDIFMKLDCEGAEYDILLNASYEDMARVSQIVMEIHTTMHPIHKGHEELDAKLLGFGFTCTLQNQLFWWNHDENGKLVITSEIPLRVVFWRR